MSHLVVNVVFLTFSQQMVPSINRPLFKNRLFFLVCISIFNSWSDACELVQADILSCTDSFLSSTITQILQLMVCLSCKISHTSFFSVIACVCIRGGIPDRHPAGPVGYPRARPGWASVLEVTVGTGSGLVTHFLCVFFLYQFRAGISVFPIHLTAPECTTAFLAT